MEQAQVALKSEFREAGEGGGGKGRSMGLVKQDLRTASATCGFTCRARDEAQGEARRVSAGRGTGASYRLRGTGAVHAANQARRNTRASRINRRFDTDFSGKRLRSKRRRLVRRRRSSGPVVPKTLEKRQRRKKWLCVSWRQIERFGCIRTST